MFQNLGKLGKRHRWLVGQMRREVHQTLRGVGNDALGFIRADPGFTPRGTGPGSILGAQESRIVKLKSGAKVVRANRATHARASEHGAAPHEIRARTKP